MLDADAKKLLDFIASRNVPSLHTMSAAEARADYLKRRFFSQPDPQEVAAVENLSAAGMTADVQVPLRSYRPLGSSAEQVLPLLLFYHGGGHTIGDLDSHDVLCRELCNRSGWAVIAVDYRRGPEHKFPAAVEDSYAALLWVTKNASALRIDPARIAIGGDSAGGNLATVVSIMARDLAGPRPIYQLLIYPATDMRFQTASYQANGQGYLLTREVIEYFTDAYMRNEADRSDWRASPALAPDLAKLPPALIITAGYDPLLDDGKAYADLLQKAGNQVEYVCYPGQIHGFITMGRIMAQANQAVALCAERLKSL